MGIDRSIYFPGINLRINIDPVAFKIFDMEIRWYGIIIALGFLVGLLIALKNAKRKDLSDEVVYDVVIFTTPLAVIFARLYYVIFNFNEYRGSLISIINIRQGGMAIYGGIIGGILGAYILSKIKKINFLKIADVCSPSIAIAQAIGRWGNFVNQEAYGYETSLPWRMQIYDFDMGKRIEVHPTFLYESLWDLIVFMILMYAIRNKEGKNGEVFINYIILYSFGRFFIEGLRTDSLMFLGMRVSQILAGVLVVIGIIALAIIKQPNKIFSQKK